MGFFKWAPIANIIEANRHENFRDMLSDSMQHNYAGGSENVIYPQTVIDVDLFFVEIPSGADFPQIKLEYLISAENMENIQGSYLIEDDSFDNCA